MSWRPARPRFLIVEAFCEFITPRLRLPPGTHTFRRGDSLRGTQFVLSIGGDGTLLDTVTYVGALQIPILGINTGRLGFLAPINPDYIPQAIEALFRGHFTLEDRSLLRLDTDPDVFGQLNFALNEFSILKRDTSSMIAVPHLYQWRIPELLLGRRAGRINAHWLNGLLPELRRPGDAAANQQFYHCPRMPPQFERSPAHRS